MLLDVGFNREVAEEGALYWVRKVGNLSNLINYVEEIPESKLKIYAKKAKQRIFGHYLWQLIVTKYCSLFQGAISGDKIHG